MQDWKYREIRRAKKHIVFNVVEFSHETYTAQNALSWKSPMIKKKKKKTLKQDTYYKNM